MRAGFDKASDPELPREIKHCCVAAHQYERRSGAALFLVTARSKVGLAEFLGLLNQLEGLPDQPPLHRRIVGMVDQGKELASFLT
jgi:hypothetical protein